MGYTKTMECKYLSKTLKKTKESSDLRPIAPSVILWFQNKE